MKIHAVLFDMDGVIVDTEPLHHKAYYKMFEENGIIVEEDLYQSFTGQTTHHVCSQLKDIFDLKQSPEELVQTKRRYFRDYFDHDPDFDLLPGVKDLIRFYHENGIKLILASSASRNTINWVLSRFDLDRYFMDRISGAELKASKPHPEIFMKAAQMAGESLENCIVIEDSTNGIKAAKSAGIYCIAYRSPHSKNQDYTLADMLIDDFSKAKILEY